MATAVILRSQDCLLRPNRFQSEHFPSLPFKSRGNLNPNSMRPRRRKRSPVGSPDRSRGQDRPVVAKFPAKNLVMGQVKILKRGEELRPVAAVAKKNGRRFGDEDLVLCSTDRLGPEPDTVQKDLKVVDGLYAGSAAFFSSPPPSSLPFPAFFAKKETNDAATSDLRRLLRLDLL